MPAKVALPDPIAMGGALAEVNDFRAILIVLVFVIVCLIGFILWRELGLSAMTKSIHKLSEAVYALRLTLIEDRILAREEALRRQREREIDRETHLAERISDKGSS